MRGDWTCLSLLGGRAGWVPPPGPAQGRRRHHRAPLVVKSWALGTLCLRKVKTPFPTSSPERAGSATGFSEVGLPLSSCAGAGADGARPASRLWVRGPQADARTGTEARWLHSGPPPGSSAPACAAPGPAGTGCPVPGGRGAAPLPTPSLFPVRWCHSPTTVSESIKRNIKSPAG